ncbi:MAG: hypothetical protein IKB36_02785 [Clostridia bacterium]|nr:hypothetical protein [Clostridia bacterium]
MKKTVFKVLSVIVALCVFLGLLPVTAFAEDVEWELVENVPIIKFSPETKIDVQVGGNTINKFYSAGAEVDTTKYFYNQLTNNQKKIYDQIWAAGPVETIDIDMTGISITSTSALSSTCQNNAVSSAQQDIIMAITALNEDKPLFFWSAGFSFIPDGIVEKSGMSYVCTITALTITMSLDTTHFADYNDVQTKYDAVVDKLATIKVNGISRHEKLKSINDYLANNLVYDDTLSEPNIYDVYGALINGLCVCEGYAEAFKLLCDREGIPCITVVGTGNGGAHKWNMVLMEDGEWYTLDSTWNDQDSNIFYSYFLNGGGTKAPWFNSDVADSTVHIPSGIIFSSAKTALVYPTLSFDAYGIGLLAPDAGDVHFDKTRGVIMVGKNLPYYYYYDIVDAETYGITSDFTTILNGSGTTTSTLTVTDGRTTKEYLVAMRGDIDASNSTNTTDYNKTVQACATTYKVDDGTAKFYAGDMTQDGAIDGFDAIALDLYIDGTITFN